MAKERWTQLSQPLFNGMPRAKSHGEVRFWIDKLSFETESGSIEACITHLEMAAHVGTQIDAAHHFIPHGPTIDQYPLSAFLSRSIRFTRTLPST